MDRLEAIAKDNMLMVAGIIEAEQIKHKLKTNVDGRSFLFSKTPEFYSLITLYDNNHKHPYVDAGRIRVLGTQRETEGYQRFQRILKRVQKAAQPTPHQAATSS